MNKPIFMIGWEFPPHNSGGLGVACQGMTRGLLELGLPVAFVLPKFMPGGGSYSRHTFQAAPGLTMDMIQVNSNLEPYWRLAADSPRAYPSDMVGEAYRYGQVVGGLAPRFDPAVLHSHDWMSIPAGLAARRRTGKPLVVQIHSTERDRSGGGAPHPEIARIEKIGLQQADQVIAVSEYTKRQLVEDYGIDPAKIEVVHNGVDPNPEFHSQELPQFLTGRPLIAFVGRLTIQKGPEYFLSVAKKVLAEEPRAVFILAGQGDMYRNLLVSAAYQGLSGSLLFAGFLRGKEKDYLYQRADVFVMPSVSEPFGIAALEAALTKTPVIVSKSAGVTEVLPNAYAIDFWDIDKMAETILRLIRDPRLRAEKGERVKREAQVMSWDRAAQALRGIYQRLAK
jgi:glycosyltransferase involved in cell wall biosynthesis